MNEYIIEILDKYIMDKYAKVMNERGDIIIDEGINETGDIIIDEEINEREEDIIFFVKHLME